MKNLKIDNVTHYETKMEASIDKQFIRDYVKDALCYWNKNRYKHKQRSEA